MVAAAVIAEAYKEGPIANFADTSAKLFIGAVLVKVVPWKYGKKKAREGILKVVGWLPGAIENGADTVGEWAAAIGKMLRRKKTATPFDEEGQGDQENWGDSASQEGRPSPGGRQDRNSGEEA
ncbi:hypothetical protein SPBR_06272 [Sporothrix brasiliensis 5110]|uniref:Uncharacterized protein n=1 Tax=Sporothrix brasiliensis 5110 TaxID=1398154 RepID=A0A0C2J474_9PEZI|nr:uncharacterized protein SPBR_06272 [Sporothrix brasiliensis 5110]KIH93825.1 hypothetical protein SPBR_06272 [Sporothrix brasiliensis 5110]